MQSYVKGALVTGEQIVHTGHVSLWGLWHLIAAGFVLLPVFGIGLIFLTIAYIRYKSTELAVTTKRIIIKYGFIRRQTIEINISKAESIQIDQGILGRLLDFGTLVISGTGTSHAPLTSSIAQPMAFRKAFIKAQDGGKRDT